MTIGTEVLTSTVVLGLLVSILGYFIRRWMERIDTKVEIVMEQRLTCRTLMLTREEYNTGMARIHERMDEHIAAEQELASRVTRLEVEVQA